MVRIVTNYFHKRGYNEFIKKIISNINLAELICSTKMYSASKHMQNFNKQKEKISFKCTLPIFIIICKVSTLKKYKLIVKAKCESTR